MLRILLFLLAFCLFPFASAHPANVAVSQIKVGPDGAFVARVRFDLSAFVTNAAPRSADDGAMNAFLDGGDAAMAVALSEAETRFRAGFASGGTIDRLAFPTVADVRQYLASDPEPRIPSMLTTVVEGHLPRGARTVAFRYPAVLDTVIQTVEFPYKEPISEPVEGGRASSTLRIPTAEEVARLAAEMNAPRVPPSPRKVEARPFPVPRIVLPPFETPVPRLEGVGAEVGAAMRGMGKPVPAVAKPAAPSASPPVPQPVVESPVPVETSRPNPFVTYLKMGFTHILPEGLDHILFVLGLFLLGKNAKALVKQITAFTVAHSITLALATLNVVRLPGRIIEPLIALSIAFVAIENLTTQEVRPWRTAVVFLFGLVHGMGFAEVFRDAGLTGGGLVTALLSFNVGVELGQLTVVGIALIAVGWFRQDPRYRRYVVLPASVAISAIAIFWTAERVFGA